ncbi:MAG: hypothetical protein KBF75_06000 [Saprospiraceae bacterium]|nr:hypothetical protein [Saprospiraceae bacterium]MCO5278858.1 hypothetical protein [Saprospiraceae bacterium]
MLDDETNPMAGSWQTIAFPQSCVYFHINVISVLSCPIIQRKSEGIIQPEFKGSKSRVMLMKRDIPMHELFIASAFSTTQFGIMQHNNPYVQHVCPEPITDPNTFVH